MHNPQFKMFVGPMFSAKSTRLLVELERLKYQNRNVAVFKPRIDVRYSAGEITTHTGWRYSAVCVETGADIISHLAASSTKYTAVAVDELFMIPGVADALIWLFRCNLDIIVSTLDISAAGKVFSEVEKLMPWATHVEKCTAVCTVCGTDARYTYKKQFDDVEIEVGGSELYEPRCFQHHPLLDLRSAEAMK